MSRHTTLQASPRENAGSASSRRLRREGFVPGVVYGAKQRTYPIQVNNKEFTDILRQKSSGNFLVNLEIEGAKEKTKLAFIQEIQQNPLSGQVIHIDFHAVKEDENIRASVPIELIGEAAGVKTGGILEQLVHSLDTECLPANLPDRISFDISDLEVGGSVHVSDLELPEGVTTPADDDVLLAQVTEPKLVLLPEDEEGYGEGEEGEEGVEGEEGAEGGEAETTAEAGE